MPIDRFSTTYAVGAPPAEVWAHLADPHSYVGLSPLVVTVRDVRPVRDDEGREAVEYVAVERFRWGPLRWDNPIRVTMTTPTGRRIVSTVVSPGAVRLESTVDLAGQGTGTEVTETIEVRSPGPLRRFVTGKARSVQAERARELTRRMGRDRS
jgi:carbon monoxide dehydrogenase subunit G